MSSELRLCVLISGNGSNLQSIINAIEDGYLPATICGVISNNPDAFGLERASQHGLQTCVVNHRDFDNRSDFDRALEQAVTAMQADFLVLAGFMRILDSDFIQAFARRIINIHPSLLPKHKGLNTHQRALENGDKEHGISIHLVTAELDDGPVLMQQAFPVSTGDTADSLQQKGHQLEHKLYPALLKLIAQHELVISEHEILFNGAPLSQPLTLEDASAQ